MKHFFSAIEGAEQLGLSSRHFWRIAPQPVMRLGGRRKALWTKPQVLKLKRKRKLKSKWQRKP